MSSVFDMIKTGLEEAIAYEQGTLPAKTVTKTIMPLPKYTADEIKVIRQKAGMTQIVFAQYMGVSKKTVEAWESGKNKPQGPACRMLAMTANDPSFPERMGIVHA